jgi:outer membrane protein insertion porin family
MKFSILRCKNNIGNSVRTTLYLLLCIAPLAGTDAGRATIKSIIIEGAHAVPHYTILSKIPYHPGDSLNRVKTRQLINNIYQLGMVSCVKVATEAQESEGKNVNLIVTITEKKLITRVVLEGNSALTTSFINKKLELNTISALDEGDFYALSERIKKLYAEKNYHNVTCEGSFKTTPEGDTEAVIKINEGKPTMVQRVFFEGNTIFRSAQLRTLLFTREDWLFGFINRAGSFQPDALEYDRSVIENHYQNHGYLMARVTDIIVDPIPNSSHVNVTFKMYEGDCFAIHEVKAAENQILSEDEQIAAIPIRPGQRYCKELIKTSMENLRMIVGEQGYIYADVMPSIIPDLEKKQVSVAFYTNLGSAMKLNRITFIGNNKTDDKVIRRQLVLDEGELITTRKLELSKNRVQSLGYFDPKSGVNWNIVRVDDSIADLELMLQEVSTGQGFAQLGFKGLPTDMSSPLDSFNVNLGVQNSNWFGRGLQGSVSAKYSQQDRSIDFNLADPWLFDRPIYGSIHVFHRRSRYDDFRLATSRPYELTTAVFGKLGLTIAQLSNTTMLGELGFESICFKELETQAASLENLIARKFQSGNVMMVGASLIQDLRNHPTHPTTGYLFNTGAKVGFPISLNTSDFGYVKWELDAQWYAPIIDEYDLVFRFHLFAGIVHQIHKFAIPYRELFHIGGPATVRGFEFGQIGPSFASSSLGSTKGLVINAELLFPIRTDGSIRGVIFYDGGSGWNTPDTQLIPAAGLINNNFDYRHAIGFGVRLTQPTAVSIDIGFKLDRRKRLGESLSEVHFNMIRDF